jgi:hypothetical protein
MSIWPEASATPAGTRRCVLNCTENYTEILQLRSLEALPGCLELQILSILRDARDGAAEQVRCRTILSADGVRALQDLLAGSQ